jgi:hypothetical protein
VPLTKRNSLSNLAAEGFRPAIVEAKLITAKRAHDAIYMATLAEELQAIDGKISALEESLHLPSPASGSPPRPCRMPEHGADAQWIRDTSCDLDLRLRRLEDGDVTASTQQHIVGPAPALKKAR